MIFTLMSGVIDAHTHCYPEEVASDPHAWANARGEAHWLELVAPEGKTSLQDWSDVDTMLADMDAAGVERAILLAWYWEHFETCVEQNRWHEHWVKSAPERFSAFASIHAGAGRVALDELKRAHEAGFVGVGEVHLGVQGVDMRDPHWLEIVNYACEHGLPINFHVTEMVGRTHAGRVATPYEDFQWLAQEFPDLKIILAHWGGLLPYYELNPHVKKIFKNVTYDTAAGPLLYDMKIWQNILDIVGKEKILFGSDYPLRLYPGKQKRADFARYLDAVRELELEPSAYESIMQGNAKRLMGL